MSYCKWWNKEQDKCIHPNAPQNGDCDWYDECCPYDEQVSEQEEITPLNEMKCPRCSGKIEIYDLDVPHVHNDTLTEEQYLWCPVCGYHCAHEVVYKEVSRKLTFEED